MPSAPEPARRSVRAPRHAGRAGRSVVLAIDDEPAVRDLMQRFLSKEGFRVVTAASGEEGLKLAREQRPARSRWTCSCRAWTAGRCLAALKADPPLAAIPVIMVSIVDDKSMGFALGASEYLTKPIDRDALVAALHKYQQGTVLHVLVVDDDAAIREMLRRMVRRGRLDGVARPRTAGRRWRAWPSAAGVDPAGLDDARDGRIRIPGGDAAERSLARDPHRVSPPRI